MNSNAGGSLVKVCGVFRYIIRNIFKLSLSDNSPFIARRAFLTFHKSFYNSVTIEGCHGAVVVCLMPFDFKKFLNSPEVSCGLLSLTSYSGNLYREK